MHSNLNKSIFHIIGSDGNLEINKLFKNGNNLLSKTE